MFHWQARLKYAKKREKKVAQQVDCIWIGVFRSRVELSELLHTHFSIAVVFIVRSLDKIYRNTHLE